MRVKICGITNKEDALCAVENGADALGFVFYEKSIRFITPRDAVNIIKDLPPFVEKVGLFVDCDAQFVNEICKNCFITLAQIHFEAEPDFYKNLEVPHIKVIRAQKKEDICRFNDEYRIVDAFVQGYGGEGQRVDLSWFDGVECSKIILAGGLNCENLEQIKQYDFYAADVSSGVEEYKGKKDSQKIKNFIQIAKQ